MGVPDMIGQRCAEAVEHDAIAQAGRIQEPTRVAEPGRIDGLKAGLVRALPLAPCRHQAGLAELDEAARDQPHDAGAGQLALRITALARVVHVALEFALDLGAEVLRLLARDAQRLGARL